MAWLIFYDYISLAFYYKSVCKSDSEKLNSRNGDSGINNALWNPCPEIVPCPTTLMSKEAEFLKIKQLLVPIKNEAKLDRAGTVLTDTI
jgi:hypothetical protein